jgi:hypothetical protein
MDPATAVAFTIGGITTVSGYGAYKLNAKAKASIDEQVKLAIGDAQAMIKSAQDAKAIAERERNKKDDEVRKLTAEISTMKKAQQQLISEKDVLSKNLDSATELEKTYSELKPEVFKQAIMDFKDNPKIKELGHPEFFEPLLSQFSVTRGTARGLYTKFANVVVGMMSKEEFDALLLDILKNGRTSLEQRQTNEAEEARVAKEKAAEAAAVRRAAKVKAAAEAQAARQVEAEALAAKKKAMQETALQNARERAAARKAAIEKAARERAEAEAFVKKKAAAAKAAADKAAAEKAAADAKAAAEKAAADKAAADKAAADAKAAEPQDRAVEPVEINKCKQTLRELGIRDLSSYRKWSRANKNDTRFAEVNNCVDIVLKNRTGGMRKKKLRTRRGGKQNVRRTRRSKNRSNRTDTYSSRRSEVDASGDELGL